MSNKVVIELVGKAYDIVEAIRINEKHASIGDTLNSILANAEFLSQKRLEGYKFLIERDEEYQNVMWHGDV